MHYIHNDYVKDEHDPTSDDIIRIVIICMSWEKGERLISAQYLQSDFKRVVCFYEFNTSKCLRTVLNSKYFKTKIIQAFCRDFVNRHSYTSPYTTRNRANCRN